jgi:hypothetical protein
MCDTRRGGSICSVCHTCADPSDLVRSADFLAGRQLLKLLVPRSAAPQDLVGVAEIDDDIEHRRVRAMRDFAHVLVIIAGEERLEAIRLAIEAATEYPPVLEFGDRAAADVVHMRDDDRPRGLRLPNTRIPGQVLLSDYDVLGLRTAVLGSLDLALRPRVAHLLSPQ